MKQALVPIAVALALCGAATAALIAALIAGNAQAETPRKPKMVAMVAPHALLRANTAAPANDGGPSGMRTPPNPQERAAQHKRMCQDQYAREVGNLAYIGARLNLTATQQPLFEHWKSVKLDIAKRGEADCATREIVVRGDKARPTPLDGMARETDMLKHRLADLDAERPVLAAFYNALTAGQKEALGPGAMGTRPMLMRRMMADGMGPHGRRPGPMLGGPGPMGGLPGGPPGPGAAPPPR